MDLMPPSKNTYSQLYELLGISACWIFIAPLIFLGAMVAIPIATIWGIITFFIDKVVEFFNDQRKNK